MGLKTLKDICTEYNRKLKLGENADYVEVPSKYVDYHDLRIEAIKWCKELKKSDNHDHSTCYPSQLCDWCENGAHKVEWIKHFFNLTEEDLK